MRLNAVRSLRRGGLCLLGFAPILVAAQLILAPLAHANPADPTWIPGSYDAADLDALLFNATSDCFTVAARKVVRPVETAAIVVEVVRLAQSGDYWGALPSEEPHASPSLALFSGLTRSPPAA